MMNYRGMLAEIRQVLYLLVGDTHGIDYCEQEIGRIIRRYEQLAAKQSEE